MKITKQVMPGVPKREAWNVDEHGICVLYGATLPHCIQRVMVEYKPEDTVTDIVVTLNPVEARDLTALIERGMPRDVGPRTLVNMRQLVKELKDFILETGK